MEDMHKQPVVIGQTVIIPCTVVNIEGEIARVKTVVGSSAYPDGVIIGLNSSQIEIVEENTEVKNTEVKDSDDLVELKRFLADNFKGDLNHEKSAIQNAIELLKMVGKDK